MRMSSRQVPKSRHYINVYHMEAARTVPTPAHTSTAAVAPFRAWRGSQFRVARGPARTTIERGRDGINS
jgi:hypothetical protein